MLSFDISALEQHAIAVDDVLAPEDPIWAEGDPVPSAPLRVVGRLSTAGPGRYYWHGRIEGDVSMACRRCLTDASAHVAGDEHIIFVDAEDEEADNPDVYPLDPRADQIDLRPALREQWLLSVPGFVLCRDDCKGLCPTCGADLNMGDCKCPPRESHDSRWDALRALEPIHDDTAAANEATERRAASPRNTTKKQRKRG
jgi:DUF177 domain-containing protein